MLEFNLDIFSVLPGDEDQSQSCVCQDEKVEQAGKAKN